MIFPCKLAVVKQERSAIGPQVYITYLLPHPQPPTTGNDKTQIAIFKLRFCYLSCRGEMKMIRAGGVFNFPEMIAHVNGNKTFRDFTMALRHLSLSRLISPSADKASKQQQ